MERAGEHMEQFEEEPTSIMFRSPGLTAFSASSPRRGEENTHHRCSYLFARNYFLRNADRTSGDTRSRVGLFGVVIQIESLAKSNMHEKMTYMFDLAQDSI